jgi:Na+/H+ antiporter NhaD/arsenite permease-like protein
MSFLEGMILAGVLAVLLALWVLYVRHRASLAEPWPDQNPKEDETARQNALRILTLALVVFALVVSTLTDFHGTVVITLPVAALALVAILVVRLRTQRDKATGEAQKRYW